MTFSEFINDLFSLNGHLESEEPKTEEELEEEYWDERSETLKLDTDHVEHTTDFGAPTIEDAYFGGSSLDGNSTDSFDEGTSFDNSSDSEGGYGESESESSESENDRDMDFSM